jgi:hypothetical protein
MGNGPNTFENSDQYEEWIEETGGRDEDRDDYYNDWRRSEYIKDLSDDD